MPCHAADNPKVAQEQQSPDPNPESQPDRQPHLDQQPQWRPRQARQDADHVVGRPEAADGKRDVLGIVEHLPVVIRRQHQEEQRDKPGARPPEHPPELPAPDQPD
jgi:hypothetical protein